MKFSQEQVDDTILKESLLNTMIDKDLYMQSIDPPSYKEELFLFYYIDKDIVVEMVKDNDSCFVAIYNDQNDSSVSFQVSRDKLKGLADFLNKHLEK